MKFYSKMLACITAAGLFLTSCQKEDAVTTASTNGIPNDVLNQITAQGYSTTDARAVKGGYVVEGDIFLSSAALTKPAGGLALRVGEEEQYHTTNLITGLPRTITVSMSYPTLKSLFTAATDTAIARYNKQKLRLKFVRVASGGEIDITGEDLGGGGILGQSSGFPDDNGNPATPIKLNSHKGTFTQNTDVQWLGTIIAHEMGHCIGFRHTDWKNRNYSCGISFPWNEGQAGVGAIYIPGTQKKPQDPGSWMLACTDGSNRPFNPNDVIALKYLYK